MNAITAFTRRVQAAYKPRGRRNRTTKLRNLRIEIEEAMRQSASPTASQNSMPPNEADEEDNRMLNGSSAESVVTERSPSVRPETSDRSDDEIVNVTAYEGLVDAVEHETEVSSPGYIEQQAIREQSYIVFYGEEADDYTYGPMRMVHGSDGLKQCVTLLLTIDFSAKIQRAIRAERDFAKLERASTRRLETALKFEGSIQNEISNHTCRIYALEEETQPDMAKIASLKGERSVLEEMMEDSKADRRQDSALLESRATILRRVQAEANAYLEEAFVWARLLEPQNDEPDTPIEERDLQQEYQAFQRNLKRCESDGSVEPLDDSRNYVQMPVLTAEQQAQQDRVDEFWEAHERLQDAQAAFHGRDQRRAIEWQMHVAAVERGEEPEDATTEDFDLRWVKCNQELTQKLVAAEAALASAKANALEVGIDMSSNGEMSASIDGQEDKMGSQEEYIVAAPAPRVTDWLTSLSGPLSPSYNEPTTDADEWEGRDVEMGDSVSVVAEGADRKRIDEWRKACMDSMSQR